MSTNKAEYMRQYMQKYRAEGRQDGTVRNRSLVRDFVGCDGEGATNPNGYHGYFMTRVGEQTLWALKGNIRLSTRECLNFLTRLDPNRIYVGYFFDYDSTKMLEDLPWSKLDRLMNRELRTGFNGQTFPVDYEGFQLDYLPHKYLKVRRMISQDEDKTTWSPWIEISDVGSFFQMSFLRAIQVWNVGTEEEQELIRIGKAQRASFDVEINSQEIDTYNALEIRLLQELMTRFREACQQAGYVPKRWQGPGLLAEAMLRKHGVSETARVSLLNDEAFSSLVEYGRKAYYGGRFEVSQIGPINVPAWQDDINSAYPHAMRFLPCLEHGGWEFVNDPGYDSYSLRTRFQKPTGRIGESFAIVAGSFKRHRSTALSFWYGLPIRTRSGSIVYPEEGRGWYWSFEVDSAIHQDFTVESMWVYTRQCKCRPLAFVEEVYTERKKLGKNGPGIVLKLGMNSLYGKMCQSIGKPKYANSIWASFITAFPRMMIQDYIHASPLCPKGCGRDIVMVATDSVTSLIERNDIAISEKLGEWSRECHPDGIFTVQPGVYFGSSGKPTKTRGFARTIVDRYRDDFITAFQRMVDTGDMNEGVIALPVQVFVGIRYALQRHDMSLMGQWLEFGSHTTAGKLMSFDWTTKRQPVAINPTPNRPWILTLPMQGSVEMETVPYSKDIGGLLEREEMRTAFEGQPDWSMLGDLYE